jgi:hypothetical protein
MSRIRSTSIDDRGNAFVALEEVTQMVELCEVRINEKLAHLLFADDEGVRLGDPIFGYTVRKVLIATDDPRFPQIGRLQQTCDERYDSMFHAGWDYIRKYTKEELAAAELFYVHINAMFEPAGEDCGTVYDESTMCPHCGMGRTMVSDLIVDLRRAPKTKDIARTVASEWIVTQRLAELLADHGMTGFDLKPARHRAYLREDPIDPRELETGRALLAKAEAAGCPHPSYKFWVWLNRPEQAEMAAEVEEEYVRVKSRRIQKRRWKPPVWFQLIFTSNPVRFAPQTRFGINPFIEDTAGEFVCPQGHTKGLNILSEVFAHREDYDGSDIGRTAEGIGRGKGTADPLLLFSPRLIKLLKDNNIRGWKSEVAYLV